MFRLSLKSFGTNPLLENIRHLWSPYRNVSKIMSSASNVQFRYYHFFSRVVNRVYCIPRPSELPLQLLVKPWSSKGGRRSGDIKDKQPKDIKIGESKSVKLEESKGNANEKKVKPGRSKLKNFLLTDKGLGLLLEKFQEARKPKKPLEATNQKPDMKGKGEEDKVNIEDSSKVSGPMAKIEDSKLAQAKDKEGKKPALERFLFLDMCKKPDAELMQANKKNITLDVKKPNNEKMENRKLFSGKSPEENKKMMGSKSVDDIRKRDYSREDPRKMNRVGSAGKPSDEYNIRSMVYQDRGPKKSQSATHMDTMERQKMTRTMDEREEKRYGGSYSNGNTHNDNRRASTMSFKPYDARDAKATSKNGENERKKTTMSKSAEDVKKSILKYAEEKKASSSKSTEWRDYKKSRMPEEKIPKKPATIVKDDKENQNGRKGMEAKRMDNNFDFPKMDMLNPLVRSSSQSKIPADPKPTKGITALSNAQHGKSSIANIANIANNLNIINNNNNNNNTKDNAPKITKWTAKASSTRIQIPPTTAKLQTIAKSTSLKCSVSDSQFYRSTHRNASTENLPGKNGKQQTTAAAPPPPPPPPPAKPSTNNSKIPKAPPKPAVVSKKAEAPPTRPKTVEKSAKSLTVLNVAKPLVRPMAMTVSEVETRKVAQELEQKIKDLEINKTNPMEDVFVQFQDLCTQPEPASRYLCKGEVPVKKPKEKPLKRKMADAGRSYLDSDPFQLPKNKTDPQLYVNLDLIKHPEPQCDFQDIQSGRKKLQIPTLPKPLDVAPTKPKQRKVAASFEQPKGFDINKVTPRRIHVQKVPKYFDKKAILETPKIKQLKTRLMRMERYWLLAQDRKKQMESSEILDPTTRLKEKINHQIEDAKIGKSAAMHTDRPPDTGPNKDSHTEAKNESAEKDSIPFFQNLLEKEISSGEVDPLTVKEKPKQLNLTPKERKNDIKSEAELRLAYKMSAKKKERKVANAMNQEDHHHDMINSLASDAKPSRTKTQVKDRIKQYLEQTARNITETKKANNQPVVKTYPFVEDVVVDNSKKDSQTLRTDPVPPVRPQVTLKDITPKPKKKIPQISEKEKARNEVEAQTLTEQTGNHANALQNAQAENQKPEEPMKYRANTDLGQNKKEDKVAGAEPQQQQHPQTHYPQRRIVNTASSDILLEMRQKELQRQNILADAHAKRQRVSANLKEIRKVFEAKARNEGESMESTIARPKSARHAMKKPEMEKLENQYRYYEVPENFKSKIASGNGNTPPPKVPERVQRPANMGATRLAESLSGKAIFEKVEKPTIVTLPTRKIEQKIEKMVNDKINEKLAAHKFEQIDKTPPENKQASEPPPLPKPVQEYLGITKFKSKTNKETGKDREKISSQAEKTDNKAAIEKKEIIKKESLGKTSPSDAKKDSYRQEANKDTAEKERSPNLSTAPQNPDRLPFKHESSNRRTTEARGLVFDKPAEREVRKAMSHDGASRSLTDKEKIKESKEKKVAQNEEAANAEIPRKDEKLQMNEPRDTSREEKEAAVTPALPTMQKSVKEEKHSALRTVKKEAKDKPKSPRAPKSGLDFLRERREEKPGQPKSPRTLKSETHIMKSYKRDERIKSPRTANAETDQTQGAKKEAKSNSPERARKETKSNSPERAKKEAKSNSPERAKKEVKSNSPERAKKEPKSNSPDQAKKEGKSNSPRSPRPEPEEPRVNKNEEPPKSPRTEVKAMQAEALYESPKTPRTEPNELQMELKEEPRTSEREAGSLAAEAKGTAEPENTETTFAEPETKEESPQQTPSEENTTEAEKKEEKLKSPRKEANTMLADRKDETSKSPRKAVNLRLEKRDEGMKFPRKEMNFLRTEKKDEPVNSPRKEMHMYRVEKREERWKLPKIDTKIMQLDVRDKEPKSPRKETRLLQMIKNEEKTKPEQQLEDLLQEKPKTETDTLQLPKKEAKEKKVEETLKSNTEKETSPKKPEGDPTPTPEEPSKKLETPIKSMSWTKTTESAKVKKDLNTKLSATKEKVAPKKDTTALDNLGQPKKENDIKPVVLPMTKQKLLTKEKSKTNQNLKNMREVSPTTIYLNVVRPIPDEFEDLIVLKEAKRQKMSAAKGSDAAKKVEMSAPKVKENADWRKKVKVQGTPQATDRTEVKRATTVHSKGSEPKGVKFNIPEQKKEITEQPKEEQVLGTLSQNKLTINSNKMLAEKTEIKEPQVSKEEHPKLETKPPMKRSEDQSKLNFWKYRNHEKKDSRKETYGTKVNPPLAVDLHRTESCVHVNRNEEMEKADKKVRSRSGVAFDRSAANLRVNSQNYNEVDEQNVPEEAKTRTASLPFLPKEKKRDKEFKSQQQKNLDDVEISFLPRKPHLHESKYVSYGKNQTYDYPKYTRRRGSKSPKKKLSPRKPAVHEVLLINPSGLKPDEKYSDNVNTFKQMAAVPNQLDQQHIQKMQLSAEKAKEIPCHHPIVLADKPIAEAPLQLYQQKEQAVVLVPNITASALQTVPQLTSEDEQEARASEVTLAEQRDAEIEAYATKNDLKSNAVQSEVSIITAAASEASKESATTPKDVQKDTQK